MAPLRRDFALTPEAEAAYREARRHYAGCDARARLGEGRSGVGGGVEGKLRLPFCFAGQPVRRLGGRPQGAAWPGSGTIGPLRAGSRGGVGAP